MKTLLRTLLSLALIVWLGAEVFFPVIAAITFTTLAPDTHIAGSIVGQLLRILHSMGLVAGCVALLLLAIAPTWGIFKSQSVLAPMVLVVLMIAGTAYSQFGIIPSMERDRIAAGGAINTADKTSPANDPLQQTAQSQCSVWPQSCSLHAPKPYAPSPTSPVRYHRRGPFACNARSTALVKQARHSAKDFDSHGAYLHPARSACRAGRRGWRPILVRAKGIERYLRYFVALGAGFLMATAVIEMTPESLRLSPRSVPCSSWSATVWCICSKHTISAQLPLRRRDAPP